MIFIASDHAGVDLKLSIMRYLDGIGRDYEDLGTDTLQSVDYPDFAHKLCNSVFENDIGILICGTGIGMSITANRYEHIRCAVVVNEDMATMTRKHNNANVIALGSRLIDEHTAINLINIFLNTEYESGRHELRIMKINANEIRE